MNPGVGGHILMQQTACKICKISRETAPLRGIIFCSASLSLLQLNLPGLCRFLTLATNNELVKSTKYKCKFIVYESAHLLNYIFCTGEKNASSYFFPGTEI
jgi:hypothetical protein